MIICRLNKTWSPEQIAGRLRLEYKDNKSMKIGFKTIYRWIYKKIIAKGYGKSTTFNFHYFKAFESIYGNLVKIFTVDRGKEFDSYNEIEKKLNIDVYFADPYSSWKRGTNKNTNGLLREFYPKKFNFSMITQNQLDTVVKIINNIPRKCFGYKTLAEVFDET